LWRDQRCALVLTLAVSLIGYSCGDDTSSPPPENKRGPLTHRWSKRFGDSSYQFGRSAALDASNNVIVTGQFSGAVDFGGGGLTSAGGDDIFVAKLDAAGNHVWSKRFGDALFQKGLSVAVDASGNAIVTGCFAGTVDFGGDSLTAAGSDDIFVAKFDAAGNHTWSKAFGDLVFQEGSSVAADALGNVIVTGFFRGTVDFGGGPLTEVGGFDIFVAKFDADGNHVWSKRFGDGSPQLSWSVTVDGPGDVIIAGQFEGTVDFGGGVLTSAGNNDIFVAKFDAAGNHVWSQRFGGSMDDGASSVATDAAGNVCLTGSFLNTVNFGGADLVSAGFSDIFLVKFISTGAHQWSKRFGDGDGQTARSVAVVGSGDVILTGVFAGTIDFGGGVLTDAGAGDLFVAKFDAGGNHLGSKRFGDENFQDVAGASVDDRGNVIVIGGFEGLLNFGGGALTGAGGWDIFLVSFLNDE
jgi:hypothetical protein